MGGGLHTGEVIKDKGDFIGRAVNLAARIAAQAKRGEILGQGVEHAKSVFAIADQRLGNHEWAVGAYSIADIHLFRLYWRFSGWMHPAPGEFPNLSRHYDRMMARAAVQRTIEAESAIGYELPK